MTRKNGVKGFTLIEVILVLAIAAMIFLMVLLTLPAVQRAQRDMQRKEDVGKAIAAYTEFLSNNRGTTPADNSDPNNPCIGAASGDAANAGAVECDLDPYVRFSTGVTYTIQKPTYPVSVDEQNQLPNATTDNIAIYKRARCGVNGEITEGDSERQIVAQVKLEGAGGDGSEIYYCQEG